jgi:hypothetical protein
VNPGAPPRTYIFQAPAGHPEAVTRAGVVRLRTTERELDALAKRPENCEREGASQ